MHITLEETTIPVTDQDHPLFDADLFANNQVAAIVRIGDDFRLLYNQQQIDLPKDIRSPIVRALDNNHCLVYGGWAKGELGQPNALLFNGSGEIIGHFFLGYCIEDIVLFRTVIAVAYFDEAIKIRGSFMGLAIFDWNGQPVWQDRFMDCICDCVQSEHELLYIRELIKYPSFALKHLDLNTMETNEWQLPDQLDFAKSMTVLHWRHSEHQGDDEKICTVHGVCLHAPYHDQTGLYFWQFGDKAAERIGDYPYRRQTRGLRNGRFLRLTETECIVITLIA